MKTSESDSDKEIITENKLLLQNELKINLYDYYISHSLDDLTKIVKALDNCKRNNIIIDVFITIDYKN
jgi:hypothetical protein